MAPIEVARIARSLADLRLQVDALETVTKAASLAETMKQARRTVHWSAALVAAALIVSSLIKWYSDDRVQTLEKRVEQLEAVRVMSPP